MKASLQADDCSPLTEAAARGELELVSLGRGQYPGRPLREGEDFGQWRLQAFQQSGQYVFTIHTICPLHYAPGEHPPRRARDWRE